MNSVRFAHNWNDGIQSDITPCALPYALCSYNPQSLAQTWIRKIV